MTGPDEQPHELTRVLHDPALRLPDDLVDLESVHRTARSRQRRRTSFAAGAAVVVVAVVGLVAVRPWQGDDLAHVPDASGTVSPSIPTSPSTGGPTPTVTPPATATTVSAVTAISADQWWVLARPTLPCTSPGCPLELYATTNGGASFRTISLSSQANGVPPGTTEIRFLTVDVGWALRPEAPTGQQLYRTTDGGRTWIAQQITQPTTYDALAIEAGGGQGWALVRHGRQVGVLELPQLPGMAKGPQVRWLGEDNGVEPALTVLHGDALVLWFEDARSRTTLVLPDQQTLLPANPCTPDLGVGSISATTNGISVSCHTGMADLAYASVDGAQTWTPLSRFGNQEAQRYVVGSIDGGLTAVGGQDGTITLAEPTGTGSPTKPRHGEVDNTEPWTYLGFTDPDHGFGITQSGHLFRSTDGGATWSPVDPFTVNTSACCATASPAGDRHASSASDAAPCTGKDIHLVEADEGGASGVVMLFVGIRNVSDEPCILSGSPTLTAAGVPVPRQDASLGWPYPSDAKFPAVLAPGQLGFLTIAANDQICRDDQSATNTRFRQLALTWDGQTLSLDHDDEDYTPAPVLNSCAGGLVVGRWYTSNVSGVGQA